MEYTNAYIHNWEIEPIATLEARSLSSVINYILTINVPGIARMEVDQEMDISQTITNQNNNQSRKGNKSK